MDEKQKEYLEEISKESTPFFPFDVIETKIKLLLMDLEILNKHPEDFPKEFRKRLQEKGIKFGQELSFYIVQEIQDFYRHAIILFGDKVNLPETAESVKEFRGRVIAHIKTKTSTEIAKECIYLENKYGFNRIYSEWREFKDKIYEKFRKKELILPKFH